MAVPTGGDKDVVPPQLVNDHCYPKNGSVNVNTKEIRLEFDEYVKLNDPRSKIFFSPALSTSPDYILRGKTLFIHFNGDLQANTTYTMHMGSAVVDITEGNPAAGLNYVFSTGPVLDSLQVNGKVINALNRNPEKGVMLALYELNQDSAFFKGLPSYLSFSDAQGNFSISHVKSGDYLLYALKESNGNYRYDASGEEAGFFADTIHLNGGLSLGNIEISLIKERREKLFVQKREFFEPGILNLIFSRPYNGVPELFSMNADRQPTAVRNFIKHDDSLQISFSDPLVQSLIVRIEEDSAHVFTDTIMLLRDEKKREKSLQQPLIYRNNFTPYLDIKQDLQLKFDVPCDIIGNDFQLLIDSVRVQAEIEKVDEKTILIHPVQRLAPGSRGILLVGTNLVKDVFGRSISADTLRFKVRNEDYYGALYLDFKLENHPNGILQLINDKGQIRTQWNNPPSTILEFPLLAPGNYKLRYIIDTDGNGEWSPGSVTDRILPEQVILFNQEISIRSNWDLELEWK